MSEDVPYCIAWVSGESQDTRMCEVYYIFCFVVNIIDLRIELHS